MNNNVNQHNNNQMNFTTLSPNRGKSIRRPNPYHNDQSNIPSTSTDNSYQCEIPPQILTTSNNNNTNYYINQMQRNTGAIPKTSNNNNNSNNNINNSNSNNYYHKVTETGSNVYINNVQPNPKPIISYNECLIMGKQFED